MISRTDGYERELARSVDAYTDDRDVCPECDGSGLSQDATVSNPYHCYFCGGTGAIEPDAMDDGDKEFERRGDR